MDPELFERCAVDLLRKVYPNLVPIRGGSDDGCDGELLDSQQEGMPLVTTTGKSATGNLKRNLQAYVKAGLRGRKAIFATSQVLTSRRRKNLIAAASKLGFELLQIHDGADFADRLYESSKWCLELLSLTGRPQALIESPVTNRPESKAALIGRDSELERLRHWDGDGLLVGQPGSGKTSLLRQLRQWQHAYFLVSNDQTAIANAIRDQRPEVVIVDDAHARPGWIAELRQLRQSIGGTFRILAASWPDPFARRVRTEFGHPQVMELSLPRLSRDAIVEVIRSSGLAFSDGWINELLNQAVGLPGLAITLCDACRGGRAKEVLDGTAVLREIDFICQSLSGQHDGDLRRVLGIFALAGNTGLDVNIIARTESISTAALTERLSGMAQAGVISVRELHKGVRIVVQPAAVRHALVKETFFGTLPMLWRPYAALVEFPDEVTRTLLGAAKRGADVNREELFALVQQTDNPDVWWLYASLGEIEARHAVQSRPDRLADVCEPCLVLCPTVVLSEVSRRAVRGETPFRQSLSEWIKSVEPGDAKAVERRRLLVETLVCMPEGDEFPAETLDLIDQVFWPAFEENVVAPGDGNRFQSRFGMLRLAQIEQIVGIWPAIFAWLRRQQQIPWKAVLKLLRHWGFPNVRHAADPSMIVVDSLHAAARQFVVDVASLAIESPAVVESLHRLAEHLKMPLSLSRDLEFRILFSDSWHRADWQEHEAACRVEVDRLAERWSEEDPLIVALRIGQFRRYRDEIDYRGTDWTHYLCSAVCQCGIHWLQWARAFRSVEAGSQFVAVFAWNAVIAQSDGIDAFLMECLSSREHRSWLIQLALLEAQLSESTAVEILKTVAAGDEDIIALLRLDSPRIPPRLTPLLRHQEASIRLAAAIAIDQICNHQISEDLLNDWKTAIIDLPSRDTARWRLEAILRAYPDLAYPLLERHLGWPWYLETSPELQSAADLLSEAERRILIETLPSTTAKDLVEVLVGTSTNCFRTLQKTSLRLAVRCSMLQNLSLAEWAEFAAIAIDEGADCEELVHVCCWPDFCGDESAEWERRLADVRLVSTNDDRVRHLLNRIAIVCETRLSASLKEERDRSVLGRDHGRFS